MRTITIVAILTILSIITYAQCTVGTVLNYQKISDTEGNFTAILDDSDRIGTSLAGIGDLNGDGINDMIVGVPRDDDGGTDRGAVYIMYLNSDRTVSSYKKISDTEGNFTGTLANSDFFGSRVAGIGDLDGDFVNDIVVSAVGDNDGGSDNGAIWILFMNTNGTVKSYQKIATGSGNFSASLESNDNLGTGICALGDLDGDGITDIMACATGDDDGALNAGAAYVLFMNTNGTVKAQQKISNTEGGLNSLLLSSDLLGSGAMLLGDINADGVQDVAISAAYADLGGTDKGQVVICFMNTDGTVKPTELIGETQENFISGLSDSDCLSGSLCILGDLDNNGYPEIGIGAFGDDDGGTDRGAIYITEICVNQNVALCTPGAVLSTTKISDTQGNFAGILDDVDQFGNSSLKSQGSSSKFQAPKP